MSFVALYLWSLAAVAALAFGEEIANRIDHQGPWMAGLVISLSIIAEVGQ